MNMGQAISACFTKYAAFEGRARRSEFWYFMLFIWLVSIGLAVTVVGVFILPLWYLAVLIPNLAVIWRRLHDTGRSGAWALLMLTFVGTIIVIVWCCEDSQPGDNMYGPNPKAYMPRNQGYGPAVTPMAPNNSYIAVQCVSGPLQGQTYHITQQGITFGTDVGCTVRLPEGTPGVSRRHCAIRWQQGVPVLVDLGSTYGTCMADGKRLPANYPERIAAGTRFYIGGWGVLFQVVNL